MKVDIITLHNINNYGSVLQTFATQEVFRSLGYETEVIDYCRQNNLPSYLAREVLNRNIRLQKVAFLWKNSKVIKKLLIKLLTIKIAHSKTPMSQFMKKNINLTPRQYTSYSELKNNLPTADIYVTGSDQVWNSSYNGGIDQAYYLGFAPDNKMKIALAASIGNAEISSVEREKIYPLLSRYHAISVREVSAVNLLKSMGLNSELVLDPTLLLNSDEWKKLDSGRPLINEGYLLMYQLNANSKMDEYAVKLAKKLNLKLIRFGFNHSDKGKAGHCIMHPSVEQFINLFSNASYVLTDSFHATAFSLNFGIKFTSILPPKFGTRIESILQLTETGDRLLTDFNDFSSVENNIDVSKVQQILDTERKRTFNWLSNALNVEENKK
ncbi:polysaccharide pyruvyl transferase family protein [Limosilactobacillus oris]|uniref:polysaccharide pyruvyl transferase family protein n=1 Tax=Limosilactobacillus oris TaxID=1632 RepID=UPI001883D1E2|nr:polysaccharide pyruvyl transferase family protein [Limosilactobacillus oris]MBF0601917.1 polysaccharide pyruvyl transferase family protein [Limosilactobacillus oris]